MKALSALAKFSGYYESYKQAIKAYGLKWTVNNDDVIIARLMKYTKGNGNQGIEALFDWVQTVKREIPDFIVFMDFIIATGLRFDEAISSYNLIAQLSKQGNLSDYYNAETEVLEHFRFKGVFIRRTKKAFMSFASKSLIESVCSSDLKLSRDIIVKRMQRLKIKQCFSDLRELYASRSVKYLRQPEIDFLQGRVSASVFMCNYFNPTWISDLKKRALKNGQSLLKFVNEQHA